MGTALLRGWVANGIGPVIVVEPKPSPDLRAFARRHHVALFAQPGSIDTLAARACLIALKPQVLRDAAAHLASIAQAGATMISIAAGTSTKALAKVWGPTARIVRAMPNTPGSIGHGITALYAA
ncbi:MAG: pyrroline-5-carboxylate reductase family protein, partial [Steroidobacteraceae bacterium]